VSVHDQNRSRRLTRLLSFALRHGGSKLAIKDEDGWFDLEDLVAALRGRDQWTDLSRSEILDLIQSPHSSRFEIVAGKVRARYGHSLTDASPGKQGEPPSLLFHTTRVVFLPAIRAHGLVAKGRRFVHLTSSVEYALSLKAAHDAETFPGIVLGVETDHAISAGLVFYQASDVVWTITSVPPELLTILVFDDAPGTFHRFPLAPYSSKDPLEDLLVENR